MKNCLLIGALTVLVVLPSLSLGQGEAEGAGYTVRGRVADSGGNPVAGARVYVFAPRTVQIMVGGPRLLSWERVISSVDPIFESWQVDLARTVSTDAEGRFEVGGLPALWDGRVCIYHPDRLPLLLKQKEWRFQGKVADLGTVTLNDGGEIRGTVRGKESEAVSGAWVAVQRVEEEGLHAPRPRSLGDIRSTKTDAEGAYRIRGLIPGRYVIASGSDRHSTVEHVVRVKAGDNRVERNFDLRPGESLTVAVTYTHDEKPYPNAHVRVRCSKDRGNKWWWGNEEPLTTTAVTGANGKCVFPHLAPGKYMVTVVPPDRVDERGRTTFGFSATATFNTGTEGLLQLEPLTPIRGKALNDETGLLIPLYDAILRPVWQKDPPSEASRNRADLRRLEIWTGRFEFEDVRPGPWTLEILANGYFPKAMRLDIPAEGLADPVILRLVQGKGRSSGTVMDDLTGEPVKGVKVLLYEWFSRQGWGNRAETWTNAEGKYVLKRLLGRSDRSWISFTKKGYVIRKVKLNGTKPHPETFDPVRLVMGAVIKGVLVDLAGKPVDGYEVWVQSAKGPSKGATRVRTNAEGRFTATGLAPGPYRVTGHKGEVEVKAGETREIRCVFVPGKRR